MGACDATTHPRTRRTHTHTHTNTHNNKQQRKTRATHAPIKKKHTTQPLGGAQGQATDIEIQANEILHHKLTLNGYLAQFSGQSMETITRDTDRDFFMSPQEAVEYGLIDAIIAKPQMLTPRAAAAAASVAA